MSGTRVGSVSSGRGVSESASVERTLPAKKPLFDIPRARVVRISESTATYNEFGAYPSKRLFQITKPVPDRPAYGSLVTDLPVSAAQSFFSGSYLRDRPIPPQYVDSLQ